MFRSPGPIAFHAGPFTLRWYGVLMATAMALGLWLAHRDARRRGLDAEDLLKAAELRAPGRARRRAPLLRRVQPRLLPTVPREDLRASGRADSPSTAGSSAASSSAAATPGCGGCPSGRISTSSRRAWRSGRPSAAGATSSTRRPSARRPICRGSSIISPQPAARAEYAQAEFFHPTFLYESLWDLVVFALLVCVFRRRLERAPGALFLAYLGLYSSGRFMTEALRTDALMLGPIRVAQLVSVLGVAAGPGRRAAAAAARPADRRRC